MSREIKFRAWDKEVDGWTKQFDIDNDGVLYPAAGKTSGNEIILMQYTGLKDMNGKDIYEGDIVMRWRIGRAKWRNKEGSWIKHSPARVIEWLEKTHLVGSPCRSPVFV